MKIERIKRRSGGDLILEITPLIDVVFLLLIFFMLATTFDESTAFKIDLPKSSVEKNVKVIKNIQLIVDKEKNIYAVINQGSKTNKEKITEKELTQYLSDKLKMSENKDVIISADKTLDYGYIVEIMGYIKNSGANSINIDTAIKK